ncbi:hypothetical protein [Pseudomonas sp. PWP3-1b2]|uniref:hypothetical protein n=1 Tax=Pseudomonas sp. PWP3-1b2 TaxID=2804656 RepID=UPI003CF24A51
MTPGNVVDIRKLPDGRTVWLEKGTDAAGLEGGGVRPQTNTTTEISDLTHIVLYFRSPVFSGLQKAYGDIGRPEFFNLIWRLIK